MTAEIVFWLMLAFSCASFLIGQGIGYYDGITEGKPKPRYRRRIQ